MMTSKASLIREEGRRLTELRRSNAAGLHDPRPRRTRTRHDAKLRAVRESLEVAS